MIMLHDDIERRAQQAIAQSQWVNGLIIKAKTELTTCAEEDREKITEQIKTLESELEKKKSMVESINREKMAWLSKIWVEGPDGKAMTADEVNEFLKDAIEQDPNFNTWLVASTSRLIREFSEQVKKGLSPRCSR
jgi:predicted RNase H-like nuclease (RuvC/YqgF family)